jgi:hypothetical protein
MMLRHRLVTGDVLTGRLRCDDARRRLRHKDPGAKFRTIDVWRLRTGHGWHEERNCRDGEKSREAFHDDPALLDWKPDRESCARTT